MIFAGMVETVRNGHLAQQPALRQAEHHSFRNLSCTAYRDVNEEGTQTNFIWPPWTAERLGHEWISSRIAQIWSRMLLTSTRCA